MRGSGDPGPAPPAGQPRSEDGGANPAGACNFLSSRKFFGVLSARETRLLAAKHTRPERGALRN